MKAQLALRSVTCFQIYSVSM